MKCKDCNNETASTEGLCSQCEYVHRMTLAGEDLDDDFDGDEDEDEDSCEPDYYWCPGCNKDYARKPTWGQCTRCDAYVEEGYY